MLLAVLIRIIEETVSDCRKKGVGLGIGEGGRRSKDEDEESCEFLLISFFFLASDSICVVVGFENWATFKATVRTCITELPMV